MRLGCICFVFVERGPFEGRVFGRLRFGSRLMFQLVDLAIGSSGGVQHASGSNLQRLHLEFFGLENDRCLAVRRDAVYAGRRTRRHIHVAGVIGGNCPDVGGGRGVQALERGRQFEAADAANGDACGCTPW